MLSLFIVIVIVGSTWFGWRMGLKGGRLDAAASILQDRSLSHQTALYAAEVALGTQPNPYKAPPPPTGTAGERGTA